MIHGLIEGRMCHYVADGATHLAAVIVKVVRNDGQGSVANLHVFLPDGGACVFKPDVPHAGFGEDRPAKPGTWHWVEKVD